MQSSEPTLSQDPAVSEHDRLQRNREIMAKREVWRRVFRISLAVIFLAPAIGAVQTVIGMMASFQALGETGGNGDSSVLSTSIGKALVLTAGGFVFSAIALVVLIVAVKRAAIWKGRQKENLEEAVLTGGR